MLYKLAAAAILHVSTAVGTCLRKTSTAILGAKKCLCKCDTTDAVRRSLTPTRRAALHKAKGTIQGVHFICWNSEHLATLLCNKLTQTAGYKRIHATDSAPYFQFNACTSASCDHKRLNSNGLQCYIAAVTQPEDGPYATQTPSSQDRQFL